MWRDITKTSFGRHAYRIYKTSFLEDRIKSHFLKIGSSLYNPFSVKSPCATSYSPRPVLKVRMSPTI
jgi:hypothetical protein